jgi:hypothetical protein
VTRIVDFNFGSGLTFRLLHHQKHAIDQKDFVDQKVTAWPNGDFPIPPKAPIIIKLLSHAFQRLESFYLVSAFCTGGNNNKTAITSVKHTWHNKQKPCQCLTQSR